MNRLTICLLLICQGLLFDVSLAAAEAIALDKSTIKETISQDQKTGLYMQYQKAKVELWKDYVNLRDELVNGYLSGRLEISYEELRQKMEALKAIYVVGQKKLLDKYFSKRDEK